MQSRVVSIDGSAIHDWESFHDAFAQAFGFPDFYGRNMNAWIDCLSYVDDEDAGMVAHPISRGEVLTLLIENVDDFARRCPEQYAAVIECAAFVNWRRLQGPEPEPSVIALAFYRASSA